MSLYKPSKVAFREEDLEAGGTQFPEWHQWSVNRLAELLASHGAVMKRGKGSRPLLREMLTLAKEHRKKIPAPLAKWIR